MTALPPTLQHPPSDAHKGDFGRVLIIGGSDHTGVRMIGAPAFAAIAAVRAGAGLVHVACPGGILNTVVSLCPSAMGLDLTALIADHEPSVLAEAIQRADSVLIGPGLGTHAGALDVLACVLDAEPQRLVVDADVINLLSENPDLIARLPSETVITPHAGEFARLRASRSLGDTGDPLEQTARLADACNAIIVRKDATTIVGDGEQSWTCDEGHVSLATGGTGDVLGGIIAALLACRAPKRTPMEAAMLGVRIHARSGTAWAKSNGSSRGMTPIELTDQIPAVMERLRENPPAGSA